MEIIPHFSKPVLVTNFLLIFFSKIGSALEPIQLLITPLWPLFGIIKVRQFTGFGSYSRVAQFKKYLVERTFRLNSHLQH